MSKFTNFQPPSTFTPVNSVIKKSTNSRKGKEIPTNVNPNYRTKTHSHNTVNGSTEID